MFDGTIRYVAVVPIFGHLYVRIALANIGTSKRIVSDGSDICAVAAVIFIAEVENRGIE
jgi:hypothetical protein